MTKTLEHLDLAGGIGKHQNGVGLRQSSVVVKKEVSFPTSTRKIGESKIMPYIQIDHPFHLKNDLKFAFTYSDESVSIGSSVCSGLRNSLHSSLSSLSLEYTDLDLLSDSDGDNNVISPRVEVPSWRVSPKESQSDWTITIESVPEGTISKYHVHKAVLVNDGHKGSDFFARLINETDITDTKTIKIHEDAAKLIQNMLDYMYANDDELEISSDSAVGLRHLSQFFGIRGLAKRVNRFIHEDVTLETMDVYLETTSAFDDMQTTTLLADQCASEIENISPLSSLVAEMDPSFILSIVSSRRFNRRKHSSHMSHIMTGYFITQRGAIDGHVFEELTAEEYLPYVDQEAALPLLILEAALVKESADETTPLSSLQLRCIEGILPMFSSSNAASIGDGEKKSRQTAMLKIPRKVLAEILSMLPIK
eukprot:CAMPEP_0172369822 /NCGR_PEP_ID=MMETSP1060-20121228/34792_1 /TAXON_ID=37318 /ORGANISM="Pseudo-nitzschia pungens, Strain cf. cingulata" /LENGTH=421 /DNA_ID=CAMNT_0013094897 /DNA_START=52 /DNA_END=1317 /DNA_ORIENTATION=-